MQCSFLFLASCILSGLKELFKDEVCYENEKVGCFKTGYPWRSLTARPFFPPPQSPSVVNVTVTVFTRNAGPTIVDGHILDFRSIIDFNDRGFDAARNKTFFIIHGFIDTGKKDWLRIMKDELLKKEDANVFIVNWGRGWFDIIHYPQAASNARVAGAELARFIEHLNSEYNLPLDKIHLIGHSLGAHVASYAAKRMKGIGRLTGLDPAQPGFEDTPIEVRLDKTDALFVDVYHTDMRPFFPLGGFGMINPVGDVDIYYNGGYYQPGCGIIRSLVKIRNWDDIVKLSNKPYLVCSHLRAYEYFTASINSDCVVWAGEVKLPDENRITFGSQPVYSLVKTCSLETCTVAGYLADSPELRKEGVFSVINTLGEDPPYCARNHENMIVNEEKISYEMERYKSTVKESTIKIIPSEIPQVTTMENDDMDEHADDFMFTSESGSQYFNEDDLYEIVTSRH